MTTIASWQSIVLLAVLTAITYGVALGLWRRKGTALNQGSAPSNTKRTTLAVVAGLCVGLFGVLTTALLTGHSVGSLDHAVRDWVRVLHDGIFVQLCTFITSMGSVEAVVAVTLVAAGLLWAHGRRPDVAGLAVSVIGSQVTTYIAKYAIARERPEFEAFAHAATPSYPSAHATGAVAVYGFIVYAIARQLPVRRARFEAIFWGTGFVVSIAATRIILGVHFASDVIAGMLVGLFWLIAGYFFSRSLSR